MKKIYLYTRYERFWHWFQMFLIFTLLLTGFEIHGTFSLLGFERASFLHNTVGMTWIISFAVFVFWIITTGEWRQYVPTSKKMYEVVRFYSFGIFRREQHPCRKTAANKHNPLQKITYLILAAVLLTFQILSGFLYWGYNSWQSWGLGWLDLKVMATLHVMNSFALLIFVIIHVYMTTTGHTLFAHLKSMITGWDEVEDD